MAYREEKTDTGIDIVIDGWETGIASSPHKGIAAIQNGNISTESGEVVASFARIQQTLQSTATGTGNLTYVSSTNVNLNIPGSNNNLKGMWITVTNSSNTTQLPNGTYYVPPSTGTGFRLANYYAVSATGPATQTASYLVVGGGGSGGTNDGGASRAGGGGGAGGFLTGSLSLMSGISRGIVVGAGGAAVSNTIGNTGGFSSIDSIVANGGGAGGDASNNGASGGSGGGGGTTSGTGKTGGTGTLGQGNNGGAGITGGTSSGGGGGAGSVGASGLGTVAGAGGNGSASSITGTSVTYAGGGGGGAGNGGTIGSGGTGGGGAGGGGSVGPAATAGTANTGGGGGGSGTIASGAFSSGAGGSGIVVISMPTGIVTNPGTAGGTYTTSGGNDIWTFTTVGIASFTPTFANIPAPTYLLSGFTAGLTANFTVVRTLGNPIAKATETYFKDGVTYYRYYILDNQNLVWVYDTQNEVLYSPSDNVNWFLPDYKTDWCTNATGIAVLDGFLIAAAQSGVYGKAVVNLGGTNTQNTTWTIFGNNIPWNGGSTLSKHFCFVGHQGRVYITDGNYIRSYFPDSTLVSGATSDNVQSLASWTVDTSRNNLGEYAFGIANPISGGEPFMSDEGLLPVVFFSNGTLPSSITANQVYYLKRDGNDFIVLANPAMDPFNNLFTLTTMPVAGSVSATLTTNWTYPTGYYYTTFFNAGGNESRNTFFTNGSTAISWSPPLTVNTNSTSIGVFGTLDLQTGAVGTQYYATFYPIAQASAPYYGVGGVGTSLSVLSTQRLSLPNFEVAQCMAEIGNTLIVGCRGNVVYPWDQVSNLPGSIISLPEGNVVNMLTVNQVAYMFAGNQGNVYITDGSLASLVLNVPDYAAGIAGSPGTYIESTYYWGDTMYLRGRVYFSILDQSATKVGNCGGVWAFYPPQNLAADQDTGTALRLESINSYGNYNGYNPILISKQTQDQDAPLYWSAWNSNTNTPTYGIDYSTIGTSSAYPTIIETDIIPIGTMLNKRTLEQIEYKLGAPLDAGATVTAKYRANATDAWADCNVLELESNRLSGYGKVNFEKGQWLQLQFTLTPITSSADSNTFIRFREIRIR